MDLPSVQRISSSSVDEHEVTSEHELAGASDHTVRVVRHVHSHYHHHIYHHQRRLSAEVPDFSYTDTTAPPSYEEVVSGVPATSSSSAEETNSLLPSWEIEDRPPAIELSDSDGASVEADETPSIVSSPARSLSDREDFLLSASPSPPVSQLSLGSQGTTASDIDAREHLEGLAINSARAKVKKVLLEIVLHLQRHNDWYSADAAYEYLAERLCGPGRAAQREADVLWEFAFQAHPLAHFGSILSLTSSRIEQLITACTESN